MPEPVTPTRIAIARDFGLENVGPLARACRLERVPFWLACALMEKESGGRNVYGHDPGGVFSRDEHDRVDARNFMQFLTRVMNGETSNGVGPAQITYAGAARGGHRDGGYFREMAAEGLLPWEPEDNMRKGLRIIGAHKKARGSWAAAGTAYNGRASYGADLVKKANEWRARLGVKGTVK